MATQPTNTTWRLGSPVKTAEAPTARDPDAADPRPVMGRLRRAPRRPPVTGIVGLGVVLLLALAALLGPLLTGDPDRQDLLGRLAPPVWLGGEAAHPLGTDGLGRDLLARILAGARLSLLVGLAATVVAGGLGVALGLAAGFAGGALDRLVSFLADVQLAIPFVIVAVALAATLDPGLRSLLVVLVATGWVGYARVVRLQTRALRHAPYVDAARSLGAGPWRLSTRHLLPNLLPPILVLATQQVAAMILYEAALSYLGLGLPNAITWGGMVADGQDAGSAAWWVPVFPGAAIALTVLAFGLLGDWLADARGGRG